MLVQLGIQLNRLLRHFGLQLRRSPSGLDARRFRLMEANRIGAVIDIGANTGQYAHQLRQLGYRGWIYSYEPLPDAFAQLSARARSDSKWRVFDLAVGEAPGSVTLNVAANSESSSILTVAQRHLDAESAAQAVSSVTVRTTTLDVILPDLPSQPTMLKIDTQGYEDRVLAGGIGLLPRVQLLEIELSLCEVYSGQILFRDMDARIVAAGFHLVSLGEAFIDRRTGELLQVDAIYARRDGAVASNVSPRLEALQQ
jgi:FkbM family methyltransferase